VNCTVCGRALPEASRFCLNCGQPCPHEAVATSPAAATPQPRSGRDDEDSTDYASTSSGAMNAVEATEATSELQAESLFRDQALADAAEAVHRSATLARIFSAVGILFGLHVLVADRPLGPLFSVPPTVPRPLLVASVVGILCESTVTGTVSQGSGTVVSSDGLVVTNAHVIPQDKTTHHVDERGCAITFPEVGTGQLKDVYRGEPVIITEASDRYDLAYLRITGPFLDGQQNARGTYPRKFPSFSENSTYTAVCAGKAALNIGDPVRIYGYPASGKLNLAITEGIVSSVMSGGRLLTSAKIDSGNSGGLAVDARGCFVGIPSAVVEGNFENLGVIIPLQHYLQFNEMVDASLNAERP
jgi:S1-C subfamily serine protease